MKVLSIIGTRPEAIKMAPVVKQLQDCPVIDSHVCVTGQHRQMLDQVLQLFDISPKYDLNLMRHNQSLTQITSAIVSQVDEILAKGSYEWVLVQGDTTTVMAAALAAFYQKVPIGHVEAGLRTYNNYQPFPEEANRRIVDTIANILFAPTKTAQSNLIEEKIPKSQIVVTGNTIVDALQHILSTGPNSRTNLRGVNEGSKLILVTAHRRENFGKPLQNVCMAIKEIAMMYPDELHFLYPVHLNPNVQKVVYRELQGLKNVTLSEPLDYQEFVYWLSKAHLVMTDSGGIQEEAVTLGKPLLIMRERTERPEALHERNVRIVGTSKAFIVDTLKHFVSEEEGNGQQVQMNTVFGDGRASERIVTTLIERSRELKLT